jgi:hypothetical protein
MDAATYQTLGTPRANTANAKDDDPFLGNTFHCLAAYQQFCPAEYSLIDSHFPLYILIVNPNNSQKQLQS